MPRCRLCTANNRDDLNEELAQEMWESQRDSAVYPGWDEASPYWQTIMRQFADATIKMLGHG